ncbi:hypothetical protein KM043_000003, partial [Ampulex compressa]
MALVRRIVPEPGESPAVTKVIEHVIEVGDARPIKTPMRRMSPQILAFVQEETMRLWKAGIIRPSNSQWCNAPVVVRKQDGGYRLCLDFRPVNKVTKTDAYPMPSMDSILDRLRGAVYLSKIDLRAAFWQIPLSETSKQYTAYAVPGL